MRRFFRANLSLLFAALSPVLVAPRALAVNAEGKSGPSLPVVPAITETVSLPEVRPVEVSPLRGAAALLLEYKEGGTLPLAAAAAAVLPPSAKVGPVAEAIARQLETVAKPSASDASVSAAGRNLAEIMQGAKPAQAGPPQGAPPAPAAPSKPGAKKIDSGLSYALRRKGLASIAWGSGIVLTLPQAGPKLTAALIKSAAGKTVVLSDFDKTLAPWGKLVSPEIGREMAAVVRAGKIMAVISDRPALMRTSKVPALSESLAAMAAKERAGIIVAGIDGYIYQYDSKGEPEVIGQQPPISEREMELIKDAAKATIARLEALGTGLAFEDPGLMTYSLVLKTDTPAAVVEAVGKVFKAELKERDIQFVIEERNPGPGKEPYINVKKMDKSWATKFLAERFKFGARETLILGDSMYVPPIRPAKGLGKLLRRLGERLSGRPPPEVGTESDRPLQKGVMGALTFSVGETAHPRMPNTFVLDGSGPEATLPVLKAVAQRPARAPEAGALEALGALAVLIVVLASLVGLGWALYELIHALVGLASQINLHDPTDGTLP